MKEQDYSVFNGIARPPVIWKLAHEVRVMVTPLFTERSSIIDIMADKSLPSKFFHALQRVSDADVQKQWYIRVRAPGENGTFNIPRKLWFNYPDTQWLDKSMQAAYVLAQFID